jgi:hypothetical protein
LFQLSAPQEIVPADTVNGVVADKEVKEFRLKLYVMFVSFVDEETAVASHVRDT